VILPSRPAGPATLALNLRARNRGIDPPIMATGCNSGKEHVRTRTWLSSWRGSPKSVAEKWLQQQVTRPDASTVPSGADPDRLVGESRSGRGGPPWATLQRGGFLPA
jgi:hypothetical protein